jgi:hypothetical protein
MHEFGHFDASWGWGIGLTTVRYLARGGHGARKALKFAWVGPSPRRPLCSADAVGAMISTVVWFDVGDATRSVQKRL